MQRTKLLLVLAIAALLAGMPSVDAGTPDRRSADERILATASSSPNNLTRIGGLVFFAATQGSTGTEPWRTDGKPSGTRLLKNISPDEFSSNPTGFEGPGPGFLFGAQDFDGHHLWKSNGTAAGTRKLADVYATQFLRVGDLTFFSGEDQGTSDTELWRTDGTPAGTRMVKNINAGGSSNPVRLHKVGNQVLFGADDGVHGFELWKSNGTAVGTKLVKDVNRSGSALPFGDFWDDSVAAAGSTLFFTATDGTHGFELWKSNGTPQGTKMVKDLRRGADSGLPDTFAVLGNRVFFSGPDPLGTVLWVSNGTNQGTHVVKRTSTSGTSQPDSMTAFKGAIYFIGFGGGSPFGTALFKTTGTAASTREVADVHAAEMVAAGNKLFFEGYDGARGYELWISDGSREGTRFLRDIRPGSESSSISNLTALGSQLIFTADDGRHGIEPWRSNGTREGTIMLKDVNLTQT